MMASRDLYSSGLKNVYHRKGFLPAWHVATWLPISYKTNMKRIAARLTAYDLIPHTESLQQCKLLSQLRSGQVSATELCERCLARAAKTQELNAFISVSEKQAREAAQAVDDRIEQGVMQRSFDGIPVAVKDTFSTTDVQTSCSSRMLTGYVPPYTATVVQRFLDQGGVQIGKTNMDEYAMGCGSTEGSFGPVRNPWKYKFKKKHKSAEDNRTKASSNNTLHPEDGDGRSIVTDTDWYISGGSSGGSAVAVATGAAVVALGSDTGGSIRNPASHCGVVGLKPTYGLLSRHGLIPLVNSMDVPGIFSQTVDDAAAFLNVLAGHDPLDSTTVTDKYVPVDLPLEPDMKGVTVGIPKEYHAPGTQQEVLDVWSDVSDRLENVGARVIEVSLPNTQYSITCYAVLCACEVASNMARYDGLEFGLRTGAEDSTEELYAASRRQGFNNVVRERILAGNYFLLRRNYEKYFIKAQKVRRLISEDFRKVYDSGVDVLLTPTLPTEACTYSQYTNADDRSRMQESDVYTQPVNLAGVPAVTVPACLSSHGLPIGLQVIGQPFKEQQLLHVAKWIEQQMNFPRLDLSFLDS